MKRPVARSRAEKFPVVLHWQNLSKIFWNLLEKFALKNRSRQTTACSWSITCFQNWELEGFCIFNRLKKNGKDISLYVK